MQYNNTDPSTKHTKPPDHTTTYMGNVLIHVGCNIVGDILKALAFFVLTSIYYLLFNNMIFILWEYVWANDCIIYMCVLCSTL